MCPFSPIMAFPTSFKAKACTRDLKDMYVSKGLCEVLPVKPAARAACLDVLNRSVLVSEIRIERLADVRLQPFDDPLRVTSHGRGRRVVHVFEDGVKHRAGMLHEPLNMRVDLTVDVRQEEQLLVSLDHETGEVHGPELVLRPCEIGHQRRQLFGERLGIRGSLDREINREMVLAHTAFSFAVRIREGARDQVTPLLSSGGRV